MLSANIKPGISNSRNNNPVFNNPPPEALDKELSYFTSTSSSTTDLGAILNQGLVCHAKNKCNIERLFMPGKLLHIKDSYINLAIISNPDAKEDELPKHMNERELSYKSLYTTKTTINPAKLFKDDKHRKQLIIGAPGIGKTTLCQYLFYNSLQGDGLWKGRFVAVFWIPLRNLKDKPAPEEDQGSLLALMVQRYSLSGSIQDGIDIKKLKDFIIDNSKNILWLLDGYDEVVSDVDQKNSLIATFLNKLYDYDSSIIMTSRPQSKYAVGGQSLKLDRTLENIGFTDDNISNYVNSFFNNSELAQDCLNLLKSNPAIWGSVHIPIVLESICSIWHSRTRKELAAITTLPELYLKMVTKIWERYLVKNEPGVKFKPEEVPLLTAMLSMSLANIAAVGFNRNEIILTSNILKQVYDQLKPRLTFAIWCAKLEQSGFIRPIITNVEETQYYFIHLSFQEYFAGIYQASVFINNDSKGKDLFKENKYNPVYRLMWQFTIGALYQHYKTTRNTLPLLSYWELALNSIDRSGKNYFKLIIDGLEGCAVDINIAVHQKLFAQVQDILFDDRYNKLLLQSPQLLRKCLSSLVNDLTEDQLSELVRLVRSEELNLNLPSSSNIIRQLIEWLGNQNRYSRRGAACRALAKLANKGDATVIKALIQCLTDQNRWLRHDAYGALARLTNKGDTTVVNALIQCLEDQDSNVRRDACNALAKLANKGDTRIIDILISRLTDQDSYVRSAACEALGEVANKGDAMIINALTPCLTDQEWQVRNAARNILDPYGKNI